MPFITQSSTFQNIDQMFCMTQELRDKHLGKCNWPQISINMSIDIQEHVMWMGGGKVTCAGKQNV